MRTIKRILDGIMRMVKITFRKIVNWEPLYRAIVKKSSRKVLVEYCMQRGAIQLDGSGYSRLKLERPEGLSENGYRISVDDILVCSIDDKSGKVRFTENAIRNYYDLIEQARVILRNMSRGGLKLNESFRSYFETKDIEDFGEYQSNAEKHMCGISWAIFN